MHTVWGDAEVNRCKPFRYSVTMLLFFGVSYLLFMDVENHCGVEHSPCDEVYIGADGLLYSLYPPIVW